ncbi:hypothetical protein HW555_003131 [Spodoptera exigua]|uniref:Uncharacterized protein n=1 Tax=Spodoptera exigua TaxID=7107 RepID=A0A835GQX5_SPOEX|nr:hypothetical protein HW555_003131 [Spodoptera exigua]
MALSVFVAGEDANSVFQGAIKPLIAECAKEYKLSDEELLKNRANEKSVGDGDAGCERAVLVATCYLEHKTAVIA